MQSSDHVPQSARVGLTPSAIFVAAGVHLVDANGAYVTSDPIINGIRDLKPGDTREVQLIFAAKLLEALAKDLRRMAESR